MSVKCTHIVACVGIWHPYASDYEFYVGTTLETFADAQTQCDNRLATLANLTVTDENAQFYMTMMRYTFGWNDSVYPYNANP